MDAEPRTLAAEDFWRDRCLDCAHPTHEMTCHELIPNGDPSNGPAYCPCAVNIDLMEQEIIRLRREAEARADTGLDALRAARSKLLRMAEAARDDSTANIAYTAFREAAQVLDDYVRSRLGEGRE